MLLRAAKARAALEGRDHALPDDVQALADPCSPTASCSRPRRRGRSSRRPPRRVARRRQRDPGDVMRGALACGALGLPLLLVGGHVDAEPLFVPGVGAGAVGAGAAGWIGAGPAARRVERELAPVG